MDEIVEKLAVKREARYLYFIKGTDVWRAEMKREGYDCASRKQKVATGHFTPEEGYIYFLTAEGHVARKKRPALVVNTKEMGAISMDTRLEIVTDENPHADDEEDGEFVGAVVTGQPKTVRDFIAIYGEYYDLGSRSEKARLKQMAPLLKWLEDDVLKLVSEETGAPEAESFEETPDRESPPSPGAEQVIDVPRRLSVNDRRTILETLPREQLSRIAEHFETNVADRRSASSFVTAILRARRIEFREVLELLSSAELQQIQEALGIGRGGREKSRNADRIMRLAEPLALDLKVKFRRVTRLGDVDENTRAAFSWVRKRQPGTRRELLDRLSTYNAEERGFQETAIGVRRFAVLMFNLFFETGAVEAVTSSESEFTKERLELSDDVSEPGEGEDRVAVDPTANTGVAIPVKPSGPKPGERFVGRSFGNWRAVRKLGAGGFGEVYEAEHQHLGGAAIKILFPHFCGEPTVRQRFMNEAIATQSIENENIVRILDVGEAEDGVCYSVMELLRGCTLRELVERGRIEVRAALEIGIQIADALQAAHDCGITHRDLKPDNLFLISRAGNPRFVKVLDFGIAKLRDGVAAPTHTATGMQLGTPGYMAPEQWRAQADVDYRVDIYALGVTLYHTLAGQLPFGNSFAELMNGHLFLSPPEMDRTDLPGDFGRLIQSMLEKDRERRPQSMREIATRLRAVLAEL